MPAEVAQVDEVLQRVVAGRAVLWVQHPVDLDEYSEPQPDVTLLRARTGHYKDRHPRSGDVLLIVEVSDTSIRYDREVKLSLYARAGIPEVWIIDLAAPEHIDLHRTPADWTYQETWRVAFGDIIEVPGLPGLPGLPGVTVEVAALLG